jgi:hypothetical protein
VGPRQRKGQCDRRFQKCPARFLAALGQGLLTTLQVPRLGL